MYFKQLQECMKIILQRDVRFVINNKVLREGKLILFNLKDYYIECMFIVKTGQQKVYEIPAPFNIYIKPDKILFDYSTKSAIKGSVENTVAVKMLAMDTGKKSKFYDNVLTIEL